MDIRFVLVFVCSPSLVRATGQPQNSGCYDNITRSNTLLIHALKIKVIPDILNIHLINVFLLLRGSSLGVRS